MNEANNKPTSDSETGNSESIGRRNKLSGEDLPDSPRDEERLKPETATINLPDVKDIPGQEHIHVAPLGEMADTTISSDDEEGVGIFDDDNEEDETDILMGTEADVTVAEQKILAKTDEDMLTDDENMLRKAELDSTDLQEEPLNEGSLATDVSGGDLDTSGTDSDDPMERIGEEDEENNTYSLGSDSNDNVTEGTP
jgi:hypothetical protein